MQKKDKIKKFSKKNHIFPAANILNSLCNSSESIFGGIDGSIDQFQLNCFARYECKLTIFWLCLVHFQKNSQQFFERMTFLRSYEKNSIKKQNIQWVQHTCEGFQVFWNLNIILSCITPISKLFSKKNMKIHVQFRHWVLSTLHSIHVTCFPSNFLKK